MGKMYFVASGETKEIEIKGEFHKAACRHDFRKGKLVSEEDIRKRRHPKKDIKICIKCGCRKGAEYGHKTISKKTL